MVTPKINNRISFGLLMFASFIALFAFIMAALASAGLTTFGWLSFAGALAWLPAVSFLGLPGSILASVLFGVFVVLSILTIAAILYSITNFLLIDSAFKKNDATLGDVENPDHDSVRGQLKSVTTDRDLLKTTLGDVENPDHDSVRGKLKTANANVLRMTSELEEKQKLLLDANTNVKTLTDQLNAKQELPLTQLKLSPQKHPMRITHNKVVNYSPQGKARTVDDSNVQTFFSSNKKKGTPMPHLKTQSPPPKNNGHN